MVQDQEKIDAILGSHKPKGHVRAIWALTLILGLSIIVIGAVVFLVLYTPWYTGTNVYFQRDKQDKTADWRTYNNERFGVSIKYPKDWAYREYLSEDKPGGGYPFMLGVAFYSEEEKKNIPSDWTPSSQGNVFLGFINNKTFDEQLEELNTGGEDYVQSSTSEEMKIGGKDFKYVITKIDNKESSWSLYLSKDEHLYYLTTSKNSEIENMKLMASKINLVDSNYLKRKVSPLNISGTEQWNAFEGRHIGFKYPTDWTIKATPASTFESALIVLDSKYIPVVEWSTKDVGGGTLGLRSGTAYEAKNRLGTNYSATAPVTIGEKEGEEFISETLNYNGMGRGHIIYNAFLDVPTKSVGVHFQFNLGFFTDKYNKDETLAKIHTLLKTVNFNMDY